MSWRVRLAAGLSALLALACGSDSDVVDDTGGQPVVFDTLPAAHYGAAADFESERRAALADGLRESAADVLCLAEVTREGDKDALIEALSDVYPYSHTTRLGLSDTPDDPSDQSGNVPPPSAGPPCGAGNLATLAERSIDCVMANCSTIPSDPGGHVTNLNCASSKCAGEYLPLLNGDGEARRCLSCLQAELTSYSAFSKMEQRCISEPAAGLVFDGAAGTVLLSKHPIVESEHWVLPSSLFRRQLLRARVDVAGGVDVYCTSLTSLYSDSLVVYPGPWGDGASGEQAWANENLLQTERIVQYVRRASGSRPAVVMGLTEGSREFADGNGSALVAANLGAASFRELERAFRLAVPGAFPPSCTLCPQNPISGSDPPGYWDVQVWLHELSPARVDSADVVYGEPVVPVEDADLDLVPLSQHYGMRAVVRIPN